MARSRVFFKITEQRAVFTKIVVLSIFILIIDMITMQAIPLRLLRCKDNCFFFFITLDVISSKEHGES